MKIEDKELKITINGEEQDVMKFLYEDFLKAGEYIYKEDSKWYIHKLKYVTFEKQIEKKIPEKLEYYDDSIAWVIDDVGQLSDVDKVIIDKLNEVLDYLKSKGE